MSTWNLVGRYLLALMVQLCVSFASVPVVLMSAVLANEALGPGAAVFSALGGIVVFWVTARVVDKYVKDKLGI